jgi:hypothetical protein
MYLNYGFSVSLTNTQSKQGSTELLPFTMLGMIIGVVVLLAVIGMVVYFGYITVKSIQSYWWPHSIGRIDSNDLTGAGRVHGVTLYATSMRYTYIVNGETHRGKEMDFMSYDNAKIVKIMTSGRYHAGQQVKVYYNPKKPSEAVIENGVKFKYLWPLFCSLLFLTVVVLGYIYGRD